VSIQKKKEQQLKLQEETIKSQELEEQKNGKWTFNKTTAPSAPAPTSSSSFSFAKRESEPAASISIGKSHNIFNQLDGVKEEREQKPKPERKP
jgi:hypothetical protein